MELCDRLEASLSAGEDIRSRLLQTFLYKVVERNQHHNRVWRAIPSPTI